MAIPLLIPATAATAGAIAGWFSNDYVDNKSGEIKLLIQESNKTLDRSILISLIVGGFYFYFKK